MRRFSRLSHQPCHSRSRRLQGNLSVAGMARTSYYGWSQSLPHAVAPGHPLAPSGQFTLREVAKPQVLTEGLLPLLAVLRLSSALTTPQSLPSANPAPLTQGSLRAPHSLKRPTSRRTDCHGRIRDLAMTKREISRNIETNFCTQILPNLCANKFPKFGLDKSDAMCV